jgi:hypothetical protein
MRYCPCTAVLGRVEGIGPLAVEALVAVGRLNVESVCGLRESALEARLRTPLAFPRRLEVSALVSGSGQPILGGVCVGMPSSGPIAAPFTGLIRLALLAEAFFVDCGAVLSSCPTW